jgi:cytochrome c
VNGKNASHSKDLGRDETRRAFYELSVESVPCDNFDRPFPAFSRNSKSTAMKKLTLCALVVVAASAAASAALAQDAAAGKTSFNKCLPCHAIGDGAKNKVGPELNGLDGRKSGTVEGYSYSDANKNSGITWNEAQFKEYIRDPKAKIPGTKMAFTGIKNDKEVDDLWAFISQYDKDGKTK